MKNYTHTFNGSGTDTWFVPAAKGKHVRVMSAGAPIDVITLAQGQQIDEGLALQGGDGFESAQFDSVQVDSATAQTVEIAVSQLPIESNRTAGGSVKITTPTGALSSADQVIAPGGTYTVPANPGRTALVLGSLSANTPAATNLRAGSAAAAGVGREISPGMDKVFNTTAAIKIFNGDANAQTVTIDEELA